MDGFAFTIGATELAEAFHLRLIPSLWLAATLLAWFLSLRAVWAAFWDQRRLVGALRWSTNAILADLVGLMTMVAVDNPERWSTLAWCLSLLPVLVCLISLVVAAVGWPSRAET